MATKGKVYKVLSGYCPDQQCKAKLFFAAFDTSIECTGCGQRHQRDALKSVEEVVNQEVALHNIFKNYLIGASKPRKGTDSVKVLGLSNYQCKLISPLLTKYGMDQKTGEPKLLKNMGKNENFDCSILGDRTFQLEEEHIETVGYGRDRTGSMNYLSGMLQQVREFNNNVECLLPIHADGDGHCLVHALSRALIGRELFWHALRKNLQTHFQTRLDTYKELFAEFIGAEEWTDIISECDPDYIPAEGEPVGLRNIHIFGLANVLKRPIILLDSLEGIQSRADYTGIFLPGLTPPDECKSRDGTLRKPLTLAWSSSGRNHYIALVGVKNRPLARLPAWMVPKCWGMPQDQMQRYMDILPGGAVAVGGDKGLQDKYILRLVGAMEKVFMDLYQVSPSLVADMNQDVYKATGITWVKPEDVLAATQTAIAERRLYHCLTCSALTEFNIVYEWLVPGGRLYDIATREHGQLRADKLYQFPTEGILCHYDAEKDKLVPDMARSSATTCKCCQGTRLRHVDNEGRLQYHNGDPTTTRSSSTRCRCGFKHYWDGKEYDNMPEMFPITFDWNGKVVGEKVYWFQHESDPSMNSNVYEVAQSLVQKHFPGEFGSERLVQRVVDMILAHTAKPEDSKTSGGGDPSALDTAWRADSSMKTILVGQQKKSIHKEELSKSQTERNIKKKIEDKAAFVQKRKTDEQNRQHQSTVPKTSKSSEALLHPDLSAREPPDGKPQSPRQAASAGSHGNSIRVTTSDGRQTTLQLPPDCTYNKLRTLLMEKLDLTEERLGRIKYGFPPKELRPPAEGEEEEPLALQRGDRVTVEVVASPADQAQDAAGQSQAGLPVAQEGGQESTQDLMSRQLLKGLSAMQDESADDIDSGVTSLVLMATLAGKDLWSYVQTMPHLFNKGGLFYQLVARDLGLSNEKHCSIPALPGKVFRYNGQTDQLEICAEPLGHFPVSPDLDKVLQAAQLTSSMSTEVKTALQAGSSGVVVNKSMKMPTQYVPFSGQGHSLVEQVKPVATVSPMEADQGETVASDSTVEQAKPDVPDTPMEEEQAKPVICVSSMEDGQAKDHVSVTSAEEQTKIVASVNTSTSSMVVEPAKPVASVVPMEAENSQPSSDGGSSQHTFKDDKSNMDNTNFLSTSSPQNLDNNVLVNKTESHNPQEKKIETVASDTMDVGTAESEENQQLESKPVFERIGPGFTVLSSQEEQPEAKEEPPSVPQHQEAVAVPMEAEPPATPGPCEAGDT